MRSAMIGLVLLALPAAGWEYSGGAECKATHDGVEFFLRDDRLHARILDVAPRNMQDLGVEWTPAGINVLSGYAVTVRTSADGFRSGAKVEVSVERESTVLEWNSDWWWAGSARAQATVQFYFHGNSKGGGKFPAYKVWTSAHPGSLPITRRLQACATAQMPETAELPTGWGGVK